MHGRRSAREGWWRAAQRSLNANMIGLHAVRPPDPAPPHFFVLRTAKSAAHVAGNGIEPKSSLCMPISVASATASGSVHSSRPDNMVCGHCFERARCRRIVACISCALAYHHTRNLRSRRGCRLPPTDLTSPLLFLPFFVLMVEIYKFTSRILLLCHQPRRRPSQPPRSSPASTWRPWRPPARMWTCEVYSWQLEIGSCWQTHTCACRQACATASLEGQCPLELVPLGAFIDNLLIHDMWQITADTRSRT